MIHHTGSDSEGEEHTRQQLLGEAWWTSKFLNMMRPGKDTSQLVKGRRLAERGQVMVTGIYAGGADAIVLGAVGGSHRVSVWVNDLGDDWEVVFRIFAGNHLLFTRLLAGDYSERLNSLLEEADIGIIPSSLEDLDYRCTCESEHHTCSHIVATYMALGTHVNDDPMVMFLLRGKTREEILSGVAEYSAPEPEESGKIQTDMGDEKPEPADPVDINRYYDPDPDLAHIKFRVASPPGKETDIIRLFGPSPFRLGKVDLADMIAAIYPEAARYIRENRNNMDKTGLKNGDKKTLVN